MFLDVSVNVNQLAAQLAKIAGPIAQQGWEAYIRQQYIIGWEQVIGVILSMVIGIGLVIVGVQVTKHDEEDWSAVVILLSFLGAVIAFIITIGLSMDAASHLLNPQYEAIQSILGR